MAALTNHYPIILKVYTMVWGVEASEPTIEVGSWAISDELPKGNPDADVSVVSTVECGLDVTSHACTEVGINSTGG